MTVVLNDASLAGGATADDTALLLALGRTLHALRRAVAARHEGRVNPYVPSAIHALTLPSGTRLLDAIRVLRSADPIMADLWRTWLKNPGYFDAAGDVDPVNPSATELTYANAPHAALRAAWLLQGILWSAGRDGWERSTVGVRVREPAGAWRDEEVTNAHQETLQPEHLVVLKQLGLLRARILSPLQRQRRGRLPLCALERDHEPGGDRQSSRRSDRHGGPNEREGSACRPTARRRLRVP